MTRGNWDAVVVGAGPAGSVTARELARRGLRVLLVDRASFPRPKVCGCCLNGNALGALAAVGLGGLPAACGAVPLTHVRLAARNRSATLALPRGVALSRETFDAALVQEAVTAGATFRPGTRARLGPTADRATLRLSDSRGESSVSTRVVVAADGLNGRLTASDGNRTAVRARSRIGAGVVAPDGPREYGPGTIFLATGRGGYVGLVRLEDDRLDVAAAFDPDVVRNAGSPGGAAERVLREAGLPPVPGLAGLDWKGTPPLTRTRARIAGERWFAVGDATGYVEPFTGEGMAWAVGAAVAVAPLAAAAATADRWDRAWEAEWAALHRQVVGGRQAVCRAAARVLRSPALTGVCVAALSVAPGLAGPVLSRLNCPPILPGSV